MEEEKEYEELPLNIYIPEPLTILIGLLAFLAGLLFHRQQEYEAIVEAYNEGYEKGARSVIQAVSQLTGQDFQIEFTEETEEEEDE